MNIVTDKPYMIFKNDYNGYTFYKLGLSKKDKTGAWINGYIRCQFNKGISLENQTKIYLKKAWLSFYIKEKDTVPCIFIQEFETVDEAIEKSKMPADKEIEQVVDNMTNKEDPFKEFGEEITLNDDDLPF